MKAVAIRAFGGPEGLAVVDLPAPTPTAGQVLITTEATGVSGAGALIDLARARDPGRRPPEAAGEPVPVQRAAPVRLPIERAAPAGNVTPRPIRRPPAAPPR